MEKKNNGTLVGILIGLVIALIIGVCLFATGTIVFKTNTPADNEQANEDNVSSIIGYYRTEYEVAQNQFTIIEFELKSDKTVNYIIGSSHNTDNTDAEAVIKYSGTYTEDEKDVILSIEAIDKDCIDGKYSCKNNIKLWKSNGSNSLIEYREDTPEYSKVDKTLLIK